VCVWADLKIGRGILDLLYSYFGEESKILPSQGEEGKKNGPINVG
jgi:hypothetical protein